MKEKFERPLSSVVFLQLPPFFFSFSLFSFFFPSFPHRDSLSRVHGTDDGSGYGNKNFASLRIRCLLLSASFGAEKKNFIPDLSAFSPTSGGKIQNLRNYME